MKLKIKNQFGNPQSLHGCDGIKVFLPYENGSVLEKKQVTILDVELGIIHIELSDFEVQGLALGKGQTFRAEILVGDTVLHVSFIKGLNVELVNGKKAIL